MVLVPERLILNSTAIDQDLQPQLGHRERKSDFQLAGVQLGHQESRPIDLARIIDGNLDERSCNDSRSGPNSRLLSQTDMQEIAQVAAADH